jgi:hypothetical protein
MSDEKFKQTAPDEKFSNSMPHSIGIYNPIFSLVQKKDFFSNPSFRTTSKLTMQ